MITIKTVELHQIAKTPVQLCYDLPQIVFAGRSNVGKSSLLRKLINRKKLVRVGSTPGVTQAIHFYRINNQFYFVDLPGYGYAKIPKSEKDLWKRLITMYFKEAINIKKVVFLLDVRRELNDDDHLFLEWVRSYHFPVLVAITKADKVSNTVSFHRRRAVMKELLLNENDCVLFSALNGTGAKEIWTAIEHTLKNG